IASLERRDLFFKTTDHQPLAEFDEIDRQVGFGMRSDLDDFADAADPDQESIGRRIGERAVVAQVDRGLHALAPLVLRQPRLDHGAASSGNGRSSSSSRALTGSSSLRFIPTRLPLSRNSMP